MKLYELCRLFTDGDWIESKDQSPKGIRLVQTGNIGEGKYLEKEGREKYISEKTFSELKCTEVFPGDVLISRLPDPVGRGCIVPQTGEKMITAVDCTICRTDENVINNEYLCYFIQSDCYYQQLDQSVTGTTRKRISRKNLGNFEIMVPSLETQFEIVHKLNKITRTIRNRQEQLDLLDELIKARFVELFGDLKINNKKWDMLGFSDIARIDTNMIHDFSEYQEYPHIGIDSIEKETGRLVGYRTVSEDGVISGKYLFTPDHIIYSKIRPNLNKVAMPDFVGVCSADAYPILVNKEKCNREYLTYVLRSETFLDYILAFSNRTNLPKVNKQQVEGFMCPVPPIELQEDFKTFVKQVDKSKVAVQKALDEAHLLFDSLMQQYFG